MEQTRPARGNETLHARAGSHEHIHAMHLITKDGPRSRDSHARHSLDTLHYFVLGQPRMQSRRARGHRHAYECADHAPALHAPSVE